MRWRTLVVTLVLTPCAGQTLAQPAVSALPNVRALHPRATRAIEAGLAQSETFQVLHDELERSDVVVYVYMTPYMSQGVSGGLSYVGASASMRFLKVALDIDMTPRQAISVLAHELRHAVEVARHPRVRSMEAFEELYRHIGFGGALRNSFETLEAHLAGQQVRDELAKFRAPRGSPRR